MSLFVIPDLTSHPGLEPGPAFIFSGSKPKSSARSRQVAFVAMDEIILPLTRPSLHPLLADDRRSIVS